MLYIAIGLFILAAVFGLMALINIFRGNNGPQKVILIHGAIAAIALLLVVFYTLSHGESSPIAALIILSLAAVGGFTFVTLARKNKPASKWMVLGHPAAAIVGLLALIFFVLKNS